MKERPKSCLIIDDDEDVLETLVSYCRDLKVFQNIVTASDGIDASLKLSNQPFDLIILDLNMPKKDGLKIVQDLKRSEGQSHNKDAKILVVSGDLKEGQLKRVLSYGVKSFIFKPFDEKQFTKKVMAMVS